MKYKDFKLTATITPNKHNNTHTLTIFAKKKNGLLFTAADTDDNLIIGAGFSFSIGLSLAYATLQKVNEKYKIYIAIPELEETIVVPVVSKKKAQKFLETNYHGYKI